MNDSASPVIHLRKIQDTPEPPEYSGRFNSAPNPKPRGAAPSLQPFGGASQIEIEWMRTWPG